MSYLLLLLELSWRFLLVGTFSVGGGLATLPFLQDIGHATGWFSDLELSNMVAVSESTPGPMGVNMASYVGFTVAGVPGSVIATASLVLPSMVVIILIYHVLKRFRESFYVDSAFYGLRAASAGLIASAFYSVLKISVFDAGAFAAGAGFFSSLDYRTLILAAVIFALTKLLKKVHPIFFIIAAAVIGVLLKM